MRKKFKAIEEYHFEMEVVPGTPYQKMIENAERRWEDMTSLGFDAECYHDTEIEPI